MLGDLRQSDISIESLCLSCMFLTRLIPTRTTLYIRYMPQLTLTSDPKNRKLSLSPQKPTTSFTTRSYRPSDRNTSPINLRRLHKEEETMAAAHKSRAKAQAEGKGVPMAEDPEADAEAVDKKEHATAHVEGDEAKGQPKRANKRSRSPEGGGVAGSRDVKRHKNAYEISVSPVDDW